MVPTAILGRMFQILMAIKNEGRFCGVGVFTAGMESAFAGIDVLDL